MKKKNNAPKMDRTDGMKVEEIARIEKCSHQYICQTIDKALFKLRKKRALLKQMF